MINDNSEPVSINQPEPPIAPTEARSCYHCIYFNTNPNLYCAVNPVTVMTYHPLQPNDCTDFHYNPRDEEEVFDADCAARFEEWRRVQRAELQAASEDAVRSVEVELLEAINRTDVEGIFSAVNRIDEVLQTTLRQRFHTVLGAVIDSDGPPASPSMLRLRHPPTLALAQAMLDQQYHELGEYVRQSAHDSEQIAQWRNRAATLSELVDELEQRQKPIKKSRTAWSMTRIGVALLLAALVFWFFLLLAGSTNIVGYSLGFFAGGLTLFLVRGW